MNKFKNFELNPNIIRALDELNFTEPTLIQQKSIPELLNSNRDLIVLSQTGTGKTAAFCLPLIQKLIVNIKKPQVLVICPTRELCVQITENFLNFSKYLTIDIVSIYGGNNIRNQIKQLKKGSQIIVGTPGRIIDLFKRGNLKLDNIKYLVLDEADEMLNMGFKDDIDFIIKKIPNNRQSLLFSATMSNSIMNIANSYLKNPKEITTKLKKNSVSNDIKHIYYTINTPRNKYIVLKRIIDINPKIYTIIFCDTRREVKNITDLLTKDKYNVDAIYSDLSQNQRELVMARFRQKQFKILVATDIAARGIDIDNITHIINYNIPDNNQIYVHRSGRTGRAGNCGISVCISLIREIYKIRNIEKKIEKKFEKLIIPTGKDILECRLYNLIEKIKKVDINDDLIKSYIPIIYEKLNDFNYEEIIKRMIYLKINKFFNYNENYKDINDYNYNEKSISFKGIKKGRKSYIKNKKLKYSIILINLGILNNTNKIQLIRLINKINKNIKIGKIIVYKKYSSIEIESNYKYEIIKKMNKIYYKKNLINAKLKN